MWQSSELQPQTCSIGSHAKPPIRRLGYILYSKLLALTGRLSVSPALTEPLCIAICGVANKGPSMHPAAFVGAASRHISLTHYFVLVISAQFTCGLRLLKQVAGPQVQYLQLTVISCKVRLQNRVVFACCCIIQKLKRVVVVASRVCVLSDEDADVTCSGIQFDLTPWCRNSH